MGSSRNTSCRNLPRQVQCLKVKANSGDYRRDARQENQVPDEASVIGKTIASAIETETSPSPARSG